MGVRQRDAFIVNPRDLVRAELAAAVAAGAVLHRDEVTALAPHPAGRRVLTRSGAAWTASKVVVATGASTNMNGLLPRRLAMDTFGATVVLVATDDPRADELPALMYLKAREGDIAYGGIIMPPLRYPDGRRYLKCAGNSLLANPLTTADEVTRWVRAGGRAEDIIRASPTRLPRRDQRVRRAAAAGDERPRQGRRDSGVAPPVGCTTSRRRSAVIGRGGFWSIGGPKTCPDSRAITRWCSAGLWT